MSDYPKYSVLMSLYIKENPQYLIAAIDSMIKQTVKPDEIVIVEDGQLTDELYAVLDEYEKKYEGLFKRVVNEKNLGLGLALNRGLEECRNELVARMDTDDISKPDRCEKQLEYFNKYPETDVVSGDIEEFIGEITNVVGIRAVPQSDKEIKEYMKKRCPLNHVAVMMKKSTVVDVGNYIDWFWNEDYYLWVRLMKAGAVFGNTGTVLVSVRTGSDMYSRRGGIKYFKSEVGIQKFMLENKIIGIFTYMTNCAKRLIVQVLLPNKVRGWVFRNFARKTKGD